MIDYTQLGSDILNLFSSSIIEKYSNGKSIVPKQSIDVREITIIISSQPVEEGDLYWGAEFMAGNKKIYKCLISRLSYQTRKLELGDIIIGMGRCYDEIFRHYAYSVKGMYNMWTNLIFDTWRYS